LLAFAIFSRKLLLDGEELKHFSRVFAYFAQGFHETLLSVYWQALVRLIEPSFRIFQHA